MYGEIENILFKLIYFNYRHFRRIYAHRISLLRAYDSHKRYKPRAYKILSRAHKICRMIHEIFRRAHNTFSCHTVNFEFTGWEYLYKIYKITKLLYCKFCIYTHPLNSKFTICMAITCAKALADLEKWLWGVATPLRILEKIVMIKMRYSVIKLIYLFTC